MKKIVIGLATFALLTSAVPAFAQETNHTPAAVINNVSQNLTSLDNSVLNAPRGTVTWSNASSAAYIEVIVTHHPVNGAPYVYESNRFGNVFSNFKTSNLTLGSYYSVTVRAFNSNLQQISSGSTSVQHVTTINPTFHVNL